MGDRQESFGKEPLLLCSFEYLYYLSLLCGREPTLTPITWPIHLVFSMSVCSTWVRTEAEHHIGVSLSSLHPGPTLIMSFLMVTMFDIIALFFLVLHIFKPRELDVKHVENLMGTWWELIGNTKIPMDPNQEAQITSKRNLNPNWICQPNTTSPFVLFITSFAKMDTFQTVVGNYVVVVKRVIHLRSNICVHTGRGF